VGGHGEQVTCHMLRFLSIVFGATVCKPVRPMLSGRCLPPCLFDMPVTLMYCGRTVGWIKMKLGMEVGLEPRHIVLNGDKLVLCSWAQYPKISAHVCCGQTAGWIKVPLATAKAGRSRLTSCASYDVFLHKELPFGVKISLLITYGVKFPKTPVLGA